MLTLSYVLAQQERYEDLLGEAEREGIFQQALKVGSASRTRVLSRALLSLERWLRQLPLVTVSQQHGTMTAIDGTHRGTKGPTTSS